MTVSQAIEMSRSNENIAEMRRNISAAVGIITEAVKVLENY